MEETKKQVFKVQVISWLEHQKAYFDGYIQEVKKHKVKMLSPKVQGQVMASAGCIAFINEQIKFIETLEE